MLFIGKENYFSANIKVQSGDIVGAAQITFLFEIVTK